MPKLLSLIIIALGIGLFCVGALSGAAGMLTNQPNGAFHTVMAGIGILTLVVGFKYYKEGEDETGKQDILDI